MVLVFSIFMLAVAGCSDDDDKKTDDAQVTQQDQAVVDQSTADQAAGDTGNTMEQGTSDAETVTKDAKESVDQ